MAGQIIQRGEKVWLVRAFRGRDASGRRRYLNKTIYGTKKDAQKWLTATLREMDLGTFVERSPTTVDEYLDKWLESAAKPRLSERTLEDYRSLLRLYVRPKLGPIKLLELSPLDIQRLYGELGERLAARTVRICHVVLNSALKQAVRWGVLHRNPAHLVQLPKRERAKVMRAMSAGEAARFLTAAKEDPHGLIFAFALATGMRPEEYLSLRWKDIDFQKGSARVERVLCWRKAGGHYFKEPKTPQSRRAIPLPATILRELHEHKRRQAKLRLQLGGRYQGSDLVFATAVGGPIHSDNLGARNFKATLKRAGLPPTVRLYDLRHTCATLLLAEGENPKVVSERLGHASITITIDIYTHVLPTMQEEATRKLERIFFG